MKAIGLVLYPGFQVLSLTVSTVFEFANITAGRDEYSLTLLSENGGLVVSSQGFAIDTQPFDTSSYDTVLVLGDNYIAEPSAALLAFVQQVSRRTRRIGATCTGTFVLAAAGLLDGHSATTHWFHTDALQKAYPDIHVEADRIFVIDGPLCTSAGMTAGVDLALALVESDLGAEISRSVARKLVLYHRRAGGQSQHSELLDLDAKSDRIQTALSFARKNLTLELSIEELAEAANLSIRQFSRIFRAETGQSPGKAVERLRVEAARNMMEAGRHSMDVIARDAGFGDRERMRRAFLRAFGQSPQTIQRVSRLASNA